MNFRGKRRRIEQTPTPTPGCQSGFINRATPPHIEQTTNVFSQHPHIVRYFDEGVEKTHEQYKALFVLPPPQTTSAVQNNLSARPQSTPQHPRGGLLEHLGSISRQQVASGRPPLPQAFVAAQQPSNHGVHAAPRQQVDLCYRPPRPLSAQPRGEMEWGTSFDRSGLGAA